MEIFVYISQVILAILAILRSSIECAKAYHERKAQDEKKEGSDSPTKDKPTT